MFNKFWEKQAPLIKASGFITTLGALFLNISIPESNEAKLLLANVQVFWLLLITVCLTVLFFRFIKYLIQLEKDTQSKYGIPVVGTFSFTIAIIFFWVISSMWGYIIDLYINSLAKFLEIIIPSVVLIGSFLFELFIEKRKDKFTLFSRILVDSFILAVLISLAGVYIQQAILKYFYHYWFFPVLPISFIVLFIVLFIITKIKKRKLFN